jgi:hypothetical protein
MADQIGLGGPEGECWLAKSRSGVWAGVAGGVREEYGQEYGRMSRTTRTDGGLSEPQETYTPEVARLAISPYSLNIEIERERERERVYI